MKQKKSQQLFRIGQHTLQGLTFFSLAAISLSVFSPSVTALAIEAELELVSLTEKEKQTTKGSITPSISYFGDRIAFTSTDPNLVWDSNLASNIFVRDRNDDKTILISQGKNGPANSSSYEPSISGLDGSFVAYSSTATNLICRNCDTNFTMDVYLSEVETGSTRRISSTTKHESDGPSNEPSISETGDRVAFTSWATNLVSNDTNGVRDVFVWDKYKGISRVSIPQRAIQFGGHSHSPKISADGRFVVFVTETGSGISEIMVRDLYKKVTLSVSNGDIQIPGEGYYKVISGLNQEPSISWDGRYIAWVSNGYLGKGVEAPFRVLVRKMPQYDPCYWCTPQLSEIWQLNDEPGIQHDPQIFGTVQPFEKPGYYQYGVVYTSTSEGRRDIMVHHEDGTTPEYTYTISTGKYDKANGHSQHPSAWADLTGYKWYVAFESDAENLVIDNNQARDIFYAERTQ